MSDISPASANSLKRAHLMVYLVATAALVLVGLWVWMNFFQTYHLETVQDGVLYRCGNRGLRELKTAVRKIRPRLVVSLIDDQELADPAKLQFQQEFDWLKAQSIRAVRIPVDLGGWPTPADLDTFIQMVSSRENQPVLVHCAQGVRRTGMFVAAYQRSVLGWSPEQARQSAPTFGHSRRTVRDIERFIDAYDAKTRAMTVQLERSKE